jgi:hypothetical protein
MARGIRRGGGLPATLRSRCGTVALPKLRLSASPAEKRYNYK